MPRVTLLERRTLQEIKGELAKIGADERGIEIMAPKTQGLLVKIKQVPTPAANILKQEMLSLGGECATHRDVITGLIPSSDVILIGNFKILNELTSKLSTQPFGLAEISLQLGELLKKIKGRTKRILNCRGKELDLNSRTHIMGVLNVTPDSFSDGGKYNDPQRALQRALEMEEEGADIIDVGGESTRPGSDPISPEEELDRIMPVLELLVKEVEIPISVDTYKARVAETALELGVHMINDISGLHFDGEMARVVADYDVPVVLMHIRGRPKDMQNNPVYKDLMGEIIDYLQESINLALESGVKEENIIVDPGIGFGKKPEDNLLILRRLGELKTLGYPLLIGPSRKSFIGKFLGLPVDQRLEGTAACVALGISNGADIVRVHDVKEMKRLTQITDLILGKTPVS